MKIKKRVIIPLAALILIVLTASILAMSRRITALNGPWQRETVKVGGTDQVLLTLEASKELPVLLFVHGGPGGPETGVAAPLLERVVERFQPVIWEQRGAGLSYSKSLDPATLTVEQFILDGGEVIDHLKKRFGVRRIVLLGDSWGGYLVLRMADRFSDNVSFVISVSPAVNVLRSEQKNYFNTLEAAKQLSEDKLLKELESVGPPVNGIYPDGIDGVMVQRQVATQLGGLTLDSSRAKSLMMSLIFADQYTYLESIRYIKGMLQSMNVMLADSGDVDLFTQVTEYKMPVLFVGGAADLYTAPEITQEYFDQIEAPWKQYLLYENAGHFALYELQDSILPVIYEVYDMFGKIHMNDLE